MPTKRPRRTLLFPAKEIAPVLKPLIKPLLKPVVESVLSRLDRHEALLQELKDALDIQFKRTAEIQGQLDRLLRAIAKERA